MTENPSFLRREFFQRASFYIESLGGTLMAFSVAGIASIGMSGRANRESTRRSAGNMINSCIIMSTVGSGINIAGRATERFTLPDPTRRMTRRDAIGGYTHAGLIASIGPLMVWATRE